MYGCDLYSREELYYRQYRNFKTVNFCEFLYINFYGYYKNFIITLILTCFFLKKSPIINSALTKLLSLTRLEPSQQQQQQQR